MCGLGVLTCTTAPGLRAASPQSNPMSNLQTRGFGCGIAGSQSKSAASLRAPSLLRATATQRTLVGETVGAAVGEAVVGAGVGETVGIGVGAVGEGVGFGNAKDADHG